MVGTPAYAKASAGLAHPTAPPVREDHMNEVAAMIEGVIRHCTEMSIDRQYVDSHGQSEVAFAFCHLLGFQLLPRLKAIHLQRFTAQKADDRKPMNICSRSSRGRSIGT